MNLVDTDVMVEVQRGTQASRAWMRGFHDTILLPAPVAWEMIFGSRNRQELLKAQRFLSEFGVEEIEPRDSKLAQALMVRYSLSTGLSIPDFVIAAQAINRSATLLSFNLKHFSSISGLLVSAPYTR